VNIIDFRKKEEEKQFATGEAFCILCNYEWVAVAETGTVHLECPECKTLKGHFKFEFNIPEGSLVRVCNCGNDLFRLSPEGHMCANCGIYQQY